MAKVWVEVIEGKNLSNDIKIDPYCIVEVYGTNYHFQTKNASNTTTPQWNQKFDMNEVDILNRDANTLIIEVKDKNESLGRTSLALETLRDSKIYHVWLKLKDSDTHGEVRVKLCVTRTRDTKLGYKQLEETIIDFCKKNNCLFEDKEFIAGDTSLYKSGKGPHTKLATWKRPSEFCSSPKLFVDGVEAGDVIQGALGDCYFLGALSVVATRKDLLEPLIVSAHPEYGFYIMKFFKNCEWNYVTIDDRIPTFNGVPIYSRCKDKNEIWVPLIEKAYAKLHRCYEALEAGSIAAALADLTGEATQTYTFEEPNIQKMIQNGSLWEEMKYFASESFLMGCSHNDQNGSNESDTGMGILRNHAYGLLDVKEPKSHKVNLISIRNPWGRLEWKGRYADNASDWTDALKNELNVTFADDGTFYMCSEDFFNQYNQVIVLRLLTDDIGKQWQKQIFPGEWRGKSAGGSTNNPTWRDNPQYGIKVTIPNTRVFISLSQPDARMQWKSEYEFPIGLHLVKTKNSTIPKVSLTNDDIIAKINYLPSRDVSLSATLQPGEYIVFPSTFNPKMEVNYWLTVYSEETIQVQPIKEEVEVGIKSEWKGGLAGGCFNHPTWVNNPKFLVSPTVSLNNNNPVHLTFMLRQPERKPFYYLGMYTGKWVNQKIDRTLCKGSKPCLNSREVMFDTFVAPGDWPQYIIPHTFDAGQESPFELYCSSSVPLKIEVLNV